MRARVVVEDVKSAPVRGSVDGEPGVRRFWESERINLRGVRSLLPDLLCAVTGFSISTLPDESVNVGRSEPRRPPQARLSERTDAPGPQRPNL